VGTSDGRWTSDISAASGTDSDSLAGSTLSELVEMAEVTYTGLNQHVYWTLRLSGISHADTMEAHALGADLEVYCYLRSECTHHEAIIESGATGTAQHLDAARLGVTADELSELRVLYRAQVTAYWSSMAEGVDPRLTTRLSPPLTSDYLAARRAGLAHPASLEFASTLAELATAAHGRRLSVSIVEMWARCRVAGLRADLIARQPSLTVDQLQVLHSVLFLLVSSDSLASFDQSELIWFAGRNRSQQIDPRSYLVARGNGWPRRIALMMAHASTERSRR
jgi:hypothetical protein